MRVVAFTLLVFSAVAHAGRDAGVPDVHLELGAALDAGAAVSHAEQHLAATARSLHAQLSKVQSCDLGEVTAQLQRLVSQNLAEKRHAGFSLDLARLERQVIDAEAYKLQTFVDTGVFPKRYFGYLDEQWDTAAYETRLKRAARKDAAACNRWLENAHAPFRVTEQEIIVTFLAEGGAILLRENQSDLAHIHPVQGIGLDDIARGFDDLEPLVKLVDAAGGTALASIVERRATGPVLTRTFSFEEAVGGTAVMWVWEKQIAETKLRDAKRPSLSTRSPAEQFVIGSLVYNSGVLFSESTITSIRDLKTGAYVFDLSEKNKAAKWALPVLAPRGSLQWVLSGADFPHQDTSWSAAYHVLQRYGGYVGLSRFTDAFDEQGALRSLPSTR